MQLFTVVLLLQVIPASSKNVPRDT